MENTIREQFVSSFMSFISQDIEFNEYQVISQKLTEFIADYDITNRKNEIAIINNTPAWIEEYIVAKIVKGCKENSMKDYLYHLKSFFDFISLPISEVSESDVQKYIGFCLRKNNNSKSYVDHKRIVINDFYTWSVNKGYLTFNPCKEIPAIHSERTSRVPYNSDELATIRNEVVEIRDKAIIETFNSSMCRVIELCRLNIEDVDFKENTIQLLGKRDKKRVSFMNSEMKHALIKYLETRTDDNPALFVSLKRNPKTKKYERMTTASVQSMTKRLSKKINVPNIQPHRFRRTSATNLVNSGVNLSDLQVMLGHTSPLTTSRYVYNDLENLRMIHKKYLK